MNNQDQLIKAYLATDYCFKADTKEICINIGKVNSDLDDLLEKLNASQWIFVTAYNPMSEQYSEQENKNRQNNLIKDIEKLKLKYFFGEGRGQDKNWPPEQSLLVIDIDNQDTLALVKKYNQKAIVKGEKNKAPYILQNILEVLT